MEEEEENGGDVVLAGPCVGGPLDGQPGESRFPKGFLLVDKPNRRAWVYDANHDLMSFVVRDPAGDTLDEEGRWRAGSEFTYDVRAYDAEVTA